MTTEDAIKELVKARRRVRLTQQDVANRMGCHVTFVQRIEANKGDRQISQLFRYAEAVGCTLGFYVDNPTQEITGL
jgi:transcriptional regulator with XRE-family HTH domain